MSLIESARVVKLVDAGDSKSPAARRAGSIPAPGTTIYVVFALLCITRSKVFGTLSAMDNAKKSNPTFKKPDLAPPYDVP